MVCCWVLLKDCRISNQNLLFQWCLRCSNFRLNLLHLWILPRYKKAMKNRIPLFCLILCVVFYYACHLRQIKFHSGYCFSIFLLKLVLSVVWNICSTLIILFLQRFGSAYDGLKTWLWRSAYLKFLVITQPWQGNCQWTYHLVSFSLFRTRIHGVIMKNKQCRIRAIVWQVCLDRASRFGKTFWSLCRSVNATLLWLNGLHSLI